MAKIELYRYTHENSEIEDLISEILRLWHKSLCDNYRIFVYPDIDAVALTMQKEIASELESITQNRVRRDLFIPKPSMILSNKNVDISKTRECVLCNLDLSNKVYENCNFDDMIWVNVSTHNTKIINCRFRNTAMIFCDMRYVEVIGGTFGGAFIGWCDLYRAYFQGLVRFAKSTITATSLNHAYFAQGVLIRKDNFLKGELLQQNENTYRLFLVIWDAIRHKNDKIKNDNGKKGEDKINEIVSERYSELEVIYKNFSSSFSSNGFSNDSNWAFVNGKKAERKVYEQQLCGGNRSFCNTIKICLKIIVNKIYDLLFGYGESLVKICMTYILVVIVFTLIYKYEGYIQSFFTAFRISLGNMVGVSSKELENQHSIFLDMLNLIQTTSGILITGIFGFILGNKIRNQ